MDQAQAKNNEPKRHLFGADGVRGIANQEPMTSEMALKLGRAIAKVLQDPVAHPKDGSRRGRPPSQAKILDGHTEHRYKILIGKDTRLSGYMFETALASGICSMGADVQLVGPMPTPGVAFLTRSMRADAGVVISASHNPYQDNGIKFFSWDGFKLPDKVEVRMEEMISNGETEQNRPTASKIGKAFRISDAVGRYIVFLKNCFPRHLTLEGLRIVTDCGHGAAYRVVPTEVGDRYVVERMLRDGYNLGGEQSGHIVFLDHNTTGDGAITCLQVLALMVEKGKRLSELKSVMTRLPQVLLNVRVREKREFESMPKVNSKIAAVQKALNGRGRTLVRYSGTEMLARVML